MSTLPESAVISREATLRECRQSAGATRRVRGAAFALCILFGINLLNFFDRQLLGALGEPIRKEFHLTPFLQRFHEMSLREASNVSAISVGAVGAIGLVAGGWLADRISAKHHNGRLPP